MKKEEIKAILVEFGKEVDQCGQTWRNIFGSRFKTRIKNEEGIILSTPAVEEKISRLKNELTKKRGKKIGKEEIGRRVEAAIWTIVDRTGKRQGTMEERAERAAERILEVPRSKKKWTVWAEIGGIDDDQEAEFGGIWFGVFGDEERVELLQSMRPERYSPEQEKGLIYTCMALSQPKEGRQKQIARTSVLAYNAEAAVEEGKRKIEEATRALNIFRYTEDGHHSWIWTESKDNNRTERLVYASDGKGRCLGEGQTNHNMHGFRLKNLMEGEADATHEYREAAQELSRILDKVKRTEEEIRIIESMMSIGRGQTEKDTSMSVLWTIIGLEQLACGNQRGIDREAETIGFVEKTINNEEIRRTMKNLYKRRHAIVHGGSTEVRDEEGITARVLGQQVALMHIISRKAGMESKGPNDTSTSNYCLRD